MKKFVLSTWSDDTKNYATINKITTQISSIINQLYHDEYSDVFYKDINIVMHNVIKVLCYWTGSTYVGNIKNDVLRTCFQNFFKMFYKLLIVMKNSKDKQFVDFANKCLYQGIAFRYLGSNDHRHKTRRIKPHYDDIYVSWSKNPANSYIESKLHGTMTIMTCNISDSYYGIDLTVFDGVSRGTEAEVVFPTIEETIINIEYR